MTDTHAFRHEPRHYLTDQQRAHLFLDKGGICHKCRRKLRPGDTWVAEHLNALSTGGDNKWGNWDVTCSWCLPKKNADDAKKAAKIRAVATAHVVPVSQRQKRGKPLPGTKRSGWKRKMDGTWERRS
jgi:5-methylcytosine-specific restriction protein A